MPRAARVCPEPGCPAIVQGDNRYCSEHTKLRQRQHDQSRPNSSERGYGPLWQRIRKVYLVKHPFCVVCGDTATEVDHIVPLRGGGSHDWNNLRSLCKHHHSAKTASEDGGFGNARKG